MKNKEKFYYALTVTTLKVITYLSYAYTRRIEMEETKTQISTNELLNFNVIEEFDNGESSFLAKKYYLMSKLAEWILS